MCICLYPFITEINLIFSFDDATQTGFERLFDYINGSNVDNQPIPMTCPVLDYVIKNGKRDVYKISFYVPYDYQPPNKGPPKPTNPDVFLEIIPEMTVGVRAFDGFANEQEDEQQVQVIEKSLDEDNLSYDSNNWFAAGYDPPFRVSNRHNEVWVQVYNYNATN